MQVIRDIVPVLGSESTSKILNAVSSLLISVELDMRLCICDLLDALAKTDPSVLVVVIIALSFVFHLDISLRFTSLLFEFCNSHYFPTC